MEQPKLLTLGDVARRKGLPEHIVKYAINSRGIKPVQRAGVIRLYSEDSLPAIESALRSTGALEEVPG